MAPIEKKAPKLIDGRIKELGDWRGDKVNARALAKLIRDAVALNQKGKR
jgi:hypothetical protein